MTAIIANVKMEASLSAVALEWDAQNVDAMQNYEKGDEERNNQPPSYEISL